MNEMIPSLLHIWNKYQWFLSPSGKMTGYDLEPNREGILPHYPSLTIRHYTDMSSDNLYSSRAS
jgi:hypothetical protein